MDDYSDDIRRPLSPRIEVYAGSSDLPAFSRIKFAVAPSIKLVCDYARSERCLANISAITRAANLMLSFCAFGRALQNENPTNEQVDVYKDRER